MRSEGTPHRSGSRMNAQRYAAFLQNAEMGDAYQPRALALGWYAWPRWGKMSRIAALSAWFPVGRNEPHPAAAHEDQGKRMWAKEEKADRAEWHGIKADFGDCC